MRKLTSDLNFILNITIVLILLMAIYIGQLDDHALQVLGQQNFAVVTRGSKQEKLLALSFDDGPHPEYTIEILDTLKKYNAVATFFVLGQHAEKYPEIVKRQILEGHEIGNHSYSHINMKKSSPKEIQKEFDTTQEIIYSISHTESKLFRPPYGNYNNDVIKVVDSHDSIIVLWTFYQDSKDWSNPGIDSIVENTLSKVQNGDIILLHDYVYKKESHTVEALKEILPALINKGYKFVTISDLMNKK